MRYALESLVDGSWSLHLSWEDAWWYARHVCCSGGDPTGNVRLHELTLMSPSTYRSETAPGVAATPHTKHKLRHYLSLMA